MKWVVKFVWKWKLKKVWNKWKVFAQEEVFSLSGDFYQFVYSVDCYNFYYRGVQNTWLSGRGTQPSMYFFCCHFDALFCVVSVNRICSKYLMISQKLHYNPTSLNRIWTQVPCRYKTSLWYVTGSRRWGLFAMLSWHLLAQS